LFEAVVTAAVAVVTAAVSLAVFSDCILFKPGVSLQHYLAETENREL